MRTLQVGTNPTRLAQAIAEFGRIDKTLHSLNRTLRSIVPKTPSSSQTSLKQVISRAFGSVEPR
jgi:hypothetical protein